MNLSNFRNIESLFWVSKASIGVNELVMKLQGSGQSSTFLSFDEIASNNDKASELLFLPLQILEMFRP